MDTTDLYILMCQQALEIQKKCPREPTEPMFTPKGRVHIFNEGNFYYYNDSHLSIRKHHWLPRQDQLQDMLKYDEQPLDSLIVSFWLWYDKKGGKKLQFTSMEQLWLAFVMKRNYNKIWNSKDWGVV